MMASMADLATGWVVDSRALRAAWRPHLLDRPWALTYDRGTAETIVGTISMFFKSSVWPLATVLSLSTPSTLGAQSLAEVARQEEARRKEIRNPAKVYTNKDLAIVPPPAAPVTAPTPSDRPVPPPAAEAPDGAKAPPQTPDATDRGATRDQKYWSGRLQDLQAQLDRDQIYTEALQSRINALTLDLTARDDPAQRAGITRDLQKATDEVDRLKLAMQRTTTAIADLEEEARRASVPPGWLR
jgi:hypothetical protein